MLMPLSEMTWISNKSADLQELTIDGKTYRYQNKKTSIDDDTINLAELGMGFSTRQIEYSITPTVPGTIKLDPSKKDTAKGTLTVYQRPYSVVYARRLPDYNDEFKGKFNKGCETDATAASCKLIGDVRTYGHLTRDYVIDKFAGDNQTFNYSGEAFTVAPVPERGVFKYQITFGTGKWTGIPNATSSGSITGFNSVGDITMGSSGNIYSSNISHGTPTINGTVTESKNGKIGDFTLNFFGPNAEEVAGKGSVGGTTFGFSGAR